jgi:RpiR family transcriptional regulator, carbohydrate utilization regulator
LLRAVMNQNVVPRLRAAKPGLTPALARIADYVLAAPDQLLALTITELAELSGGSESAVIRLCRALGFDGFQDLKLALATEMVTNPVSPRAQDSDVVTQLAESGAMALSDTARLLDREAVTSAVRALLDARRIHLFGVGASGITCAYLAYKLLRLGLHAHVQEDAHLAAMASASITKDDVFVIVSSTGSTMDAVKTGQNARERGASVIAITNRSKSPLVNTSSIILLAAAPETPLTGGAYASKISQFLIVDALFAGLTEAQPDLADAIARTASIVSERSY